MSAQHDMPPPAIATAGLRCTVHGRVVLDLPALQVAVGEHVVVVGPNGAGKSTLLRCLSGFVQPAQGQVAVLGRQLGQDPLPRPALRELRRDVGQVLQGLHLVARLSVLDNTLIGALGRLHGAAAVRSWWREFPAEETAAALRALQAVGLAERAHDRADGLSGGERQKMAMARLLLQRPQLVLADEPTASLDPHAAHAACQLLRRAAAGATLLTIVHEPALVPLLGDRVIGLRGGRLAFDRPAGQVNAALLAELYQHTPAAAPRAGSANVSAELLPS
ncbi:MAG: ATP-binding cassette domain-containing protein [Rubrivivax sp.]|nr:ATP-binding cassette domain-containing protein [Rubrivivax sp.]MDP3615397.1 ATP-binding cassette domain-containing protein [Rubrivivax sp.]